MVERFNGKIKSKVFKRSDRQDMETKLIEYLNRYNFEVRLKQIDYMTPADSFKKTSAFINSNSFAIPS
ncbi:MAG: hypothetical protein UU28_C0001G0038 [Parcubacteria group bacterium GW2011_GWD2_40_9]|nr:MAG: hypothetical protein UU28_C0001G0038 [Parcubacteria group bacterium GW2011_GWD2_40_9]